MSKQKRLVFHILRSSEGHLTAKEVFDEARKEMPKIALGTVYRNLTSMVEAGEISMLNMPDGANIFDITPSPHSHLICSRCGKIKDVPSDDLMPLLKDALGVDLDSYSFTAYYLCEECKKKS